MPRILRILLPILLLSLVSACRSKKPLASVPDPRWAVIDSLAGIGQYATALERTDVLLNEAKAANDWRTEFKAWMRRAGFQELTGIDQDSIINPMDRRAAEAGMPLSQLLRTTLMDRWWQRYQYNRWQIMERTELDGSFDAADPETWTQGRYIERVIREARASLEPFNELRNIPVDELGDLLGGDSAARYLRPTLYDVLAQRALRIFSNTETRLAEPSWRFTLNDPKDFELFEPFLFRPLEHRDSTAWEFQSMRIYQRLERAHINADKLDAYVDVVLQRLAYVRERSVLPEKDSLYLGSLELLRTRLPEDACEAEVMVAIARWHEEQANKYGRLRSDDWKWERRTAVELCNAAIAKWPGTFGARNASALLSRMQQPSLSIASEQAVPPGKDFLALMKYRNSTKAWLRIVSDPERDEDDGRYQTDRYSWLLKQKAIKEWSIELPDDGDFNEHAVELAVDALPLGRYAIIIANGASFQLAKDEISWCEVNVTDLALVHRDDGSTHELLVLNRTTGKPIEGATVRALIASWESGQQRKKEIGSAMTAEDGSVRFKLGQQRGHISFHVKQGDDQYTSGGHYTYERYLEGPDSIRTFLFTDRAIYRPGQEIRFKGIVTVKRGKRTEVLPDYETEVWLSDANGEEVDTLTVTTDRFGAFHGRFTIPLGRLTGYWSLWADDGDKGLRVEEYKRPTFEVVFVPVSGTPKLGEEAMVTGVAKGYAGAPLDGAKVKYTVSRNAMMPWWCGWRWGGLPWGRSTEVASGEATCDAQGKFTVKFTAEADRVFPRPSDPSFNYVVSASVTDITGETHDASTSLVVGYRSIDLELGINSAIDRSTADSALIRVVNLNGQEQPAPFNIRITRLMMPVGGAKRDRVSDRPDRFMMVKEEFARRLPHDQYDNERDPETWARGSEVMRGDSIKAGGKRTSLRGIRDWEVGTYIIEMEALDPSGQVVKASKVFTLFDPEIQNTGFEKEAFHVQLMKERCEPGEKVVLLLSTALPECRVLMEVERDGRIAVVRPFQLKRGQQRVELPVMEEDRGGFTVHFVCVERGRQHISTHRIEVPWTNKQLKVEWMSFRDKLLPGAKEEWRLKIAGPKKEQVAAQVLATMYDASLDRFAMPEWWMSVWGSNQERMAWGRALPFGAAGSRQMVGAYRGVADSTRRYPHLVSDLYLVGWGSYRGAGIRGNVARDEGERELQALPGVALAGRKQEEGVFGFAADAESEVALEEVVLYDKDRPGPPSASSAPSPLRTDFRETAFFFPDLLTDRDGNVVLRFTMPDALTRWNFMGLAHTADLKTAQFSRSTVTQKPLMVVPNLPRFLRQGDHITLTAKVNVIEGGTLKGNARLELFDPTTNKPVSELFNLKKPERAFTAAPGSSAVVSWSITVPEKMDVVAVRITGTSGSLSDGEERPLPILTDRVLVTESLPIAVTKAGTKTFELSSLLNAQSSTLRHQSLKLEYTPNPAWYAVQALPYLMEFPHECAEQIFSRYYANHLATHIVKQRPQVKRMFDAWSKGAAGNEQAFLGNLEKNPELKGIVLEETPWLLSAKDEGERKRRIALFFDLHRMANEDAASLKKLGEMQLPQGGWGWWSGMLPSRYITQHIVAGFGHLQQLDALDLDPDTDARRMIKRAIDWLDQEVEREHQRQLRGTKRDSLPDPSSEDIHYLYARSSFPQHALERRKGSAAEFMLDRAQRNWLRYGMQEQAMIAIILHRLVDEEASQLITTSLAQRATMSDELGMHWKDFSAGFAWNTFPTETHALMIEAFELVARDKQKVNALRQYLLKLKQTTDWKTTKATADACYALLLTGDDWLEPKSPPVIMVGNEEVKPAKSEAGTGYFERSWKGEDVKTAMGRVTVTTAGGGVQWGALHWQYFEQMDKVKGHESPFSLRRQVMLKEQTDAGPRLIEWDKARALKPGDRLTVRVELRTNRWLDFVHLKDLRAAGLEPVDALSGYEWKGGLGYYRSIRDAAMHFFFDRVAPGTYVFEYELKVTHAGEFSNGITTAMCMYAPEFSSHSEGLRLKVGE
ncbi:MAG TPA: MG2 domain-containing protein [Flavobacteriales bacterium]|nr:MG2 domain-containing protein [Flavobacteriales bacterium]